MEKTNPISADQPGLHGGPHRVPAGVRQFHFGGAADFGGVGVGPADGAISHLLDAETADAEAFGYGGAAFGTLSHFRSDRAARAGGGSGVLPAFENGRKIHAGANWRGPAGAPGIQGVH
ncbi:hypothetical protein CIRMBP1230_00893 [Enterococcus cecorum]|nr:hypothetical protein CIRMBP1230_00893 [Enterococcus cecorum]CAI3351422.1 hypothetical protein CIRMBP1229_00968 [Enterococcus cecorum]